MFLLELEPEVEQWLLGLPAREFGQAAFHLDLLADRGDALGFPHTSQLSGKLRELRCSVGGRATRLTYFVAGRERIVILTVFVKQRRHEGAQISRALRAMELCNVEGHTADTKDVG